MARLKFFTVCLQYIINYLLNTRTDIEPGLLKGHLLNETLDGVRKHLKVNGMRVNADVATAAI
jgi:hypothetical protein